MQREAVTVLLAEDHTLVREGTRRMLEQVETIQVVGEAEDGLAAVRLAQELEPDVLLLDMGLPELNGLGVTRAVTALPRAPRVLILSAHDEADYVTAALSAGAGGYLVKTAGLGELVAAIGAVSRGEIVLHPAVARKALGDPAGGEHSHSLSPRELDVIRLAARGLRTSEIAAELSISTRTVESDFTRIFKQLGVATRAAAVLYAAGHGWVRSDWSP